MLIKVNEQTGEKVTIKNPGIVMPGSKAEPTGKNNNFRMVIKYSLEYIQKIVNSNLEK